MPRGRKPQHDLTKERFLDELSKDTSVSTVEILRRHDAPGNTVTRWKREDEAFRKAFSILAGQAALARTARGGGVTITAKRIKLYDIFFKAFSGEYGAEFAGHIRAACKEAERRTGTHLPPATVYSMKHIRTGNPWFQARFNLALADFNANFEDHVRSQALDSGQPLSHKLNFATMAPGLRDEWVPPQKRVEMAGKVEHQHNHSIEAAELTKALHGLRAVFTDDEADIVTVEHRELPAADEETTT